MTVSKALGLLVASELLKNCVRCRQCISLPGFCSLKMETAADDMRSKMLHIS